MDCALEFYPPNKTLFSFQRIKATGFDFDMPESKNIFRLFHQPAQQKGSYFLFTGVLFHFTLLMYCLPTRPIKQLSSNLK
jgi:hypothetical protein